MIGYSHISNENYDLIGYPVTAASVSRLVTVTFQEGTLFLLVTVEFCKGNVVCYIQ